MLMNRFYLETWLADLTEAGSRYLNTSSNRSWFSISKFTSLKCKIMWRFFYHVWTVIFITIQRGRNVLLMFVSINKAKSVRLLVLNCTILGMVEILELISSPISPIRT